MKSLLSSFILFCTLSSAVYSAEDVIVLSRSPGARQLGLAEAGTALTDRGASYFYNPALPYLSFNHSRQSMLSWQYFYMDARPLGIDGFHQYNKSSYLLIDEKDLDYARSIYDDPKAEWIRHIAYPSYYNKKYGYFGLHTNYYRSELGITSDYFQEDILNEIIYTLTLNPALSHYFFHNHKYSFGLNLKYYDSEGRNSSASGMAFDFGFAYESAVDLGYSEIILDYGASLLNLGPKAERKFSSPQTSIANNLPLETNFGAALKFRLLTPRSRDYEFFHILYLVDISQRYYDRPYEELQPQQSPTYHLGMEVGFLTMFDFRLGQLYNHADRINELHFGFGIKTPEKIKKFHLEKFYLEYNWYGIRGIGNRSLKSSQNGFSINFGYRIGDII